MQVITFNQRVKQGAFDFIPTAVNYGMGDDAAAFFIAAGWASASDGDPHITYGDGEGE